MEILGKKVLVLGGAGMVGRSICRELIKEDVGTLVISSLFESETRECIAELESVYPGKEYIPEWGDIFVRSSMKDISRKDILNDHEKRLILVNDIINPMSREILHESTLFGLLTKYKPDIVIDSINTASIIAYQNIFGISKEVFEVINHKDPHIQEIIEKLLGTQYVPQLIRHVQILLQSMIEAKTKLYLKVGTCGTGGMGLNIPYTHSEDRPSQMLLAKSAIAGAHTLLLFLMARTPGGPIIKEIKPAAAIAWKDIAYGPIMKKGQKIFLEDVTREDAVPLTESLSKRNNKSVSYIQKDGKPKALEAPYIDTGENGFFSMGEFEALTDEGQMEFITPEEVAQCAAWEIQSFNTGHDIVAALDSSILGSTYRAGYMRHAALTKLERLIEITHTDSVAFEILGPPRLSKLLYEGYLLNKCFSTFEAALAVSPKIISQKLENYIMENQELRGRIISIGIPLLLPSGDRLLRGSVISIPNDIPGKAHATFEITPEQIDLWTHDGWIDLREKNMAHWQERFKKIQKEIEMIPSHEMSSSFPKGPHYWQDNEGRYPIAFAKLASWIFSHEDKGERMK